MLFNEKEAPFTLVQIQNITNKDGSALAADNWRNDNIGIITQLTLAGGIKRLTPFFQGKFRMDARGKVVYSDITWWGNASTGPDWPIEVAPGLYDFETNTSIYRFRVLEGKEEEAVWAAITEAVEAFKRSLVECLRNGGDTGAQAQ